MNDDFFISKTTHPLSYNTTWDAPSNIALIKYWGKKDLQIPKNPSISFTLSKSITQTSVDFKPSSTGLFNFNFFFDGELKPEFKSKLQIFFKLVKPYISWIERYELTIRSKNNFPHSSGIASSASAMAALSLALMDLERYLFKDIDDVYFYQKASFLARIGSGSASRSIQGPVSIWGKNKHFSNSSDLFAIPFGMDLNPIFNTYQNVILLVHTGTKSVSSRQGHDLMKRHPFSKIRFEQAKSNFEVLVQILKSGDLDAFIEIVELEALSLHAMMMTSNPNFILMKPNTLSIIQKIRVFRATQNIPLCFTLDAGANVHLLYPLKFKFQVKEFINQELSSFCHNHQYIEDHVGQGAKKV